MKVAANIGRVRAHNRRARIYAVAGAGLSSDAYHMTAPHPDSEGAISVMKNLKDTNINPQDWCYKYARNIYSIER